MYEDDMPRLLSRVNEYLTARQSGLRRRAPEEIMTGFEAEVVLEAIAVLLADKVAAAQ